MKKKISNNAKLWLVFGVIAVVAIAFLFMKAPAPPEKNETIKPNVTLEEGASFGDLLTINYVLYFENGTVADTNNVKLAEEAGLINYVKGNFKFILGQSGKVKGFDEAITGMNENDPREVIIEPSEPVIILKVNRTRIVNRFVYIPRHQAFPQSAFKGLFKQEAILGDVVFNKELQFRYQVVNITEKHVIAKIIIKEGEVYRLQNTEWDSKAVKVADKDIMFYQIPKENQTVSAPFGTSTISLTGSRIYFRFDPVLNRIFDRSLDLGGGFGLPQQFQVTEISEDDFTIKRYGLLTDKRLKFSVDLLEIVPDVKKVKQSKSIITETVGGVEN